MTDVRRDIKLAIKCVAAGAGVLALVVLFLVWTGTVNSYHIAGPFYLQPPTAWDREHMTLYRCPMQDSDACATDPVLPDGIVFSAGADSRHIVLALHPRANDVIDKAVTQYFYFARVPQEFYGWGSNPEKIVGPLTPDDFAAAKAAHHLPGFSVVLDDLK